MNFSNFANPMNPLSPFCPWGIYSYTTRTTPEVKMTAEVKVMQKDRPTPGQQQHCGDGVFLLIVIVLMIFVAVANSDRW